MSDGRVKKDPHMQTDLICMGYIHVCIHAYGFHMRVCMYIVSPLAGLGGGILWRPPAYSLLKLIITIDFHIF